jgi:hypothetical protein
MALLVEVEMRVGWAPDGGGNTFLAQFQANVPGQGQTEQPRIGFAAQVRQYIVAEGVPVAAGSEGSVTLANINTALTNAVADLAGASGTPIITPAELAIIQGWASGSP